MSPSKKTRPGEPSPAKPSAAAAGASAGASASSSVLAKDDIDEGLYSRQLYVMGKDAQRKMSGAHVLIAGLDGLGAEIAKNVVLAGVRAVTLYDPTPARARDLGSHFYLTPADVGKPRADACAAKLAELNAYVSVTVLPASAARLDDPAALAPYSAVVMNLGSVQDKCAVNDACRAAGAARGGSPPCFIACDARGGLASWCFSDFGDAFTVSDLTGEEPVSRIVASVTPAGAGAGSGAGSGADPRRVVVAVHDEARHGLEENDAIALEDLVDAKTNARFSLAHPLRVVRVTGPFTLEAELDPRDERLPADASGGNLRQVKLPVTLAFKPLRAALANPDGLLATTDFAKLGRPEALCTAFQAVETAKSEDELAALVEAKHGAEHVPAARALFRGRGCVLSPMAAFLGGIVGQEVLKACSGKFTPLRQLLFFDAVECLPPKVADWPAVPPASLPSSRYEDEERVFGTAFVHERLRRLRVFLVGSGAIGCEMLKNWALMGVATSGGGKITVTDPDKIERSNLNRQFLFRNKDIGSNKSAAAARAVKDMNADVVVEAREDKVAPETEGVYDETFFANVDVVVNALDNVEARLYVDGRCVTFGKPLLESGTLGTKGNTQVVVPHVTENYGATRDPPERSFPVCTLKNFPHAIEHTLAWARDWFELAFAQTPQNAVAYKADATKFLASLEQQQNSKIEVLEGLAASLVGERPATFEDCLAWGRRKFEEQFSNQIKQLRHSFPPDMVTSTGALFWSGTKRLPTPLAFDARDALHVDFCYATACLRAFNFGIPVNPDRAAAARFLASVAVPPFEPQQGKKIAKDDAELKQLQEQDREMSVDEAARALVSRLPPPASAPALAPIEFEKDDDSNHHMEFICAASNLRARNYSIPEADLHKSKLIAGKIIPAIATTTALVTGLVCFELYKLVAPWTPAAVEPYKCGFVNLALPLFAFSEPVACKKTLVGKREWSLWDKISLRGPLTLTDFLKRFKADYDVDVSMISFGSAIVYSTFLSKPQRLGMPLERIVQEVTKAPVPANALLHFVVCCQTEDGEDADLPQVEYRAGAA